MAVNSLLGQPWRMSSVAKVFCMVVLSWVGASTARAEGETLYGALIMATNVEHPSQPPEELRSQAANLHTIFGYNEFRVLGNKRKPVTKVPEDWLVPSKQFFLRVDTKNPVPGGYVFGLELLKDDHPIVEANVRLNRERPLFISGPFVGRGQLIILLMVL